MITEFVQMRLETALKEGRRENRRRQIESAAQAVLVERGFASASVLEVAKRAKASNETLYRWYGDKNGLFAALVMANAAAGRAHLEEAASQDTPLDRRLITFGVTLLRGILSDSAIELNRAAAADQSGSLGHMIAKHGRDTIMPLLAQLLESSGAVSRFDGPMDAAEVFIALLVGDSQARRIIGTLPEPDAGTIETIATRATARFLTLAAV